MSLSMMIFKVSDTATLTVLFWQWWFHYFILGTIKFHKICHWPEWIENFGNPSNYNGETWETAHKWYIKRWVGLLPHSNSTSMTSLIRRTLVFEVHGGSDLLYQKPTDAHHTWYKVAGCNPDSSFRKLYIPRNDAWATIGNYILFRGGTPGGDVGLLMTIRSTGGGFTLGLNMCVCDNSESKLSSYCQRWQVDSISARIHCATSQSPILKTTTWKWTPCNVISLVRLISILVQWWQ